MVPDAPLKRVPEMMDTPPIQYNHAFIICKPSIIWLTSWKRTSHRRAVYFLCEGKWGKFENESDKHGSMRLQLK